MPDGGCARPDDAFQPHRTSRDDLSLHLTHAETLLHTRGPLPQVKEALGRALTLATVLADTELQMACLRGLSEYELWTGDSHAAIAVAKKIRALAAAGRGAGTGDADAQAGSVMSWLGALAASRHQLEDIVRRPLGHNRRADAGRFEFDQRLTAAGSLATVLWLQGFPDQAIAVARRQLADAEASNYAVSRCYALLHGSLVVALYIRDYAAAADYLARGLDHAAKHGLAIWRAMGLGVSTRLALYTGRPVDLAACRAGLDEVRDGGFRMRYPNYLTNYGEALARQGDPDGGLAAIDEPIALSESRGQTVGIPEMLRIRGNVLRLRDRPAWDEAAARYRRAIDLARRDGARSWELRATMSLVALGWARGGDAVAEHALPRLYDRFEDGFSTGDLRRARRLIETRPDWGGRISAVGSGRWGPGLQRGETGTDRRSDHQAGGERGAEPRRHQRHRHRPEAEADEVDDGHRQRDGRRPHLTRHVLLHHHMADDIGADRAEGPDAERQRRLSAGGGEAHQRRTGDGEAVAAGEQHDARRHSEASRHPVRQGAADDRHGEDQVTADLDRRQAVGALQQRRPPRDQAVVADGEHAFHQADPRHHAVPDHQGGG
jgi:tetratricopeptide (TPR) repeat protein